MVDSGDHDSNYHAGGERRGGAEFGRSWRQLLELEKELGKGERRGKAYGAGTRRPLGDRERRGRPQSSEIAGDIDGDAELDSGNAAGSGLPARSGKKKDTTAERMASSER